MLTLGVSQVDITPPLGSALSGWEPERFSERVYRPLEARTLYVSDNDQAVVIVALDVLGMSSELAGDIRNQIHVRLGVPPAAVMLACSHTHSGPVLGPWRAASGEAPDRSYVTSLSERIVGGVAQAARATRPVTVGYASGTCDLGVNRRLVCGDGRVAFPPRANPAGPADPDVGVLRFNDESGEPAAILFGYGCHPTVSGPSTWIGPDYPGAARAVVEKAFPSAMAAFVLGNCGDVRSNYTNTDGRFRWDTTEELVEEAGQGVGSVVVQVAGTLDARPVATLSRGRAVRPVFTQDDRLIEHSEFLALGLGAVTIVSNPAECFSGIGLDVRRETSQPLMFASVTNGFFGYVPTGDAYPLGGYEVEHSWRSFGLSAPVRSDTHHAFREGMLAAVNARHENA